MGTKRDGQTEMVSSGQSFALHLRWNVTLTSLLPQEQFSSEWDQYELNPDEGAANEFWPPEWYPWEAPFSGPGRYTYKSNIWHIGMVRQRSCPCR